MPGKNIAFAGVFCLFLGNFSSSLFAFDFEKFNRKVTGKISSELKLQSEKDHLDFLPNAKEIFRLDLQVAADKFSKEDLEKSEFKAYDVDGFHLKMGEKDKLVMAKTAVLFPHKKPDLFSINLVSSLEYLKASFNYEEILENVSNEPYTVSVRKEMGPIGNMDLTFHFGDYNILTGVKTNVSDAMAKKLLAIAPLGEEKLEMINTRHSSDEDISKYSDGARITNYYYNVGNAHTLLVSIEMIIFNKEDFGALWLGLNMAAARSQRSGKKRSITRIREYLYGI